MSRLFDAVAEEYDRWYDRPEGADIFRAEAACLRLLGGGFPGRWLEVGVGTGRFACALGIREGIDPSPGMLALAAGRGIDIHEGCAEALPVAESSFDGILMALALCFVADAGKTLREGHRVLRPGGRLLIGLVPADSAWGRAYAEKASKGHPVYARAHFRTAAEIVESARKAGFALADAASTLFWKPSEAPQAEARLERAIIDEAGFVGLLLETPVNIA